MHGRHPTPAEIRLLHVVGSGFTTHAVLCELVPGGFPNQISPAQADKVLHDIDPHGAMADARMQLAHELLEDLRRIDEQRRAAKRRIGQIVTMSKTSLTDIYGVGPVVAATVLGYVGRFPSRDLFAAYNGTAPSRSPHAATRSVDSPGAGTDI